MICKNNNRPNRDDITNHMVKNVDKTKYFYKKNVLSQLHYHKDEKFISDILNECINTIFSNLENGIYYFKYEIYGKGIVQPYLMFLSKGELKKLTIFNINEKEYKNKIFGIRFEFIDPDANRYVYIITIE